MKATVKDRVIADSDDIVEARGYFYFPPQAVRTEWLKKTTRTAKDLECPHGVQFYDVVIEGEHFRRAAWVYETPRPEMRAVKDRFGFWQDVTVS
jgi:uncharacterized protein (DUF427 family)